MATAVPARVRVRWVQKILMACAAVAITNALAAPAQAAAYPIRPVRLVLGMPPGGGSDAVARIVSPKLAEVLGTQWVVDNRSGANGNIASEIVARADPDGHTVLLGFSHVMTANPWLYKLSFDISMDLQPVVMLAAGQYMLVVHPSVKANTLAEFIELAKSRPRALNYSSAGLGSVHHLAMELFSRRAGISLVHVPYKGGGPATVAVIGGEVQALFASLVSSMAQARGGRVRAIAAATRQRVSLAPELPTIAKLGFPGFEITSWYGLFVPARTPVAIVQRLHTAAVQALDTADVREAISRQGLEIVGKGPVPFAAQLKAETAQWGKIIEAAGIRGE